MLRWAERLGDALGPIATVETFRSPDAAVWQESSVGGVAVVEAAGRSTRTTGPEKPTRPRRPIPRGYQR